MNTVSKGNPQITVIIADVNGPPMIGACLEALSRQQGEVDTEVIVAESTGEETVRFIQDRFPKVKVLPFAKRLTIPELRAAALKQSSGDIVAVIEDHCDADEYWCQGIVNAHQAHPECIAVGGAVENGSCQRLIDWAVYFAEYSDYMQPLPRGVVDAIPGNNVTYKRAAFQGIKDLEKDLSRGFWESTLHQKLLARGERFLLEPSITVHHSKRFGFCYSLSQRFHYSRYYAGTFYAAASLPTRLLRAAITFALPPLLMARICRRVVHKKRHLKELTLATPYLAVLTLVWACGELVGSLFGPGRSLVKVE